MSRRNVNDETTKENKIYFNSNISVDLVKIYKDAEIDYDTAVAQKEKIDADTTLWNNFSTSINASYFASGAANSFVIYRKTPSQKYYDYVCTIENGQYQFWDYKIEQAQYYHYLAVIRREDGSYITYENVDEEGEPEYIKAVWDNWSICNIEQDEDNENIYYKTGNVWLLGLNFASENITKNINVMNYETLGQFNKFGMGKKNYESGSFSSLLGAMKDVTVYDKSATDDTWTSKTSYTYTERDSYNAKYSREVEKLNRWRTFCTDGKLKLLKDIKGHSWIIQIVSTPTFDINNQATVLPTTISFDWQEAINMDGVTIIRRDT